MTLLQIATIVAYIFVVVAYANKVMKVAKMPLHLRWELYPVPHEKGKEYGGSYLEEAEWWHRPQPKSNVRSWIFLLKKYFLFHEYHQRDRKYWMVLYPWHIGFYLIVLFDVLIFLEALAMVTIGLAIGPDSANPVGIGLYYLTIVLAIVSFILGSIGSIGLLVQRLTNKDLKHFATPSHYFNYIFFLLVFLSGLVSYFFDPTLAVHREFWASLFTLQSTAVDPAAYAHIMLFALFLMYLPFTRSTHYITSFFAFFKIFWDDRPYFKGSDIDSQVKKLLDQPVSWSAPHIRSGAKWSEIVSEGVKIK